jgi:hypothetical protein
LWGADKVIGVCLLNGDWIHSFNSSLFLLNPNCFPQDEEEAETGSPRHSRSLRGFVLVLFRPIALSLIRAPQFYCMRSINLEILEQEAHGCQTREHSFFAGFRALE